MEKVFKGFKVLEKEGLKGKYYMLSVENLSGKTTEMFLTESQKELIDLEGESNCSVSIAERKSKENRPYRCIALAVGDEIFDFFPRDRAFISLALAVAKKKIKKAD